LDLVSYQRIAEPSYTESSTSCSLNELRARRAECQRLEDALSLLRRLVQGHLDIVRSEQRRRAAGEAPDLAALVAVLPRTLAEHGGEAGAPRSRPTAPAVTDPALTDPALTEELDAICDVVRLSRLPDLGDDELEILAADLAALERTVSARRRVVFERLDVLSSELTSRYRNGAASVDALLRDEAGGARRDPAESPPGQER
jgi:hypothetical protein